MKKVLVLVANYPNNDGGVSLMYVHTRNKYYVKHEIDVTVLNFATEQVYVKDGIKVISLNEYEKDNALYDVLILHAPNIRNHYKFLIRNDYKFSRVIFFFHGHEVLRINKSYPKPYVYMQTGGWLRKTLQDAYDTIKLKIWKMYLPKLAYKSDYVFVSNSFYYEFINFTGMRANKLQNHVHIINNGVDSIFQKESYDINTEKKYDFITIRNMLDESVYCIDLLCDLAFQNLDKKFLLIGKGKYFEHNEKPSNIEWIDCFLNHSDMLKFVNQSKCALMLSKRDTQGVMSCELMTYGIPIIVSDIPICREIFGDCKNVVYHKNEDLNIRVIKLISTNKEEKFFDYRTIEKEIELIKR